MHISQLDSERVNTVEDVVGMGDEITVMVTDIDPRARSVSRARPCWKAGPLKKPAKKISRAAAVDAPAGTAPAGVATTGAAVVVITVADADNLLF